MCNAPNNHIMSINAWIRTAHLKLTISSNPHRTILPLLLPDSSTIFSSKPDSENR